MQALKIIKNVDMGNLRVVITQNRNKWNGDVIFNFKMISTDDTESTQSKRQISMSPISVERAEWAKQLFQTIKF